MIETSSMCCSSFQPISGSCFTDIARSIKTFVIQGEHRLYHANGELKDVRPTGSYTVSPPGDEPHREGGGDQDVVVLFTIYDREGPLYEILDDDSNIVATLSTNDFVNFYDRKH